MGQTLLPSLLKKILPAVMLLAFSARGVFAQTTLSAGDLTIVTVNADDPDNFDFVPLVDLEAGTEIYFTDNAYVSSDESLRDNEGTLRYTAAQVQSAGTVISYTGTNENGFEQLTGNYNATASGDNIIAYQANTTDTTYLYGVGWANGQTVWEYDSGTSPNNRSDIPPGLSKQDDTILDLGIDANLQYNPASGLSGTRRTVLSLIGEASNWSSSATSFAEFSETFSLLDLPTMAFGSITQTGIEGSSVDIPVKLVEGNGKEVSVEVAYRPDASTAGPADIDNYSTQTVVFRSGSASGDIQTISLNLPDNQQFEGTRKAVFELKNISTGTIISPDVLTLSIQDDETPNIVINEFLADPPESGPDGLDGDANGDGRRDGYEDEFVELVNNSSMDVDLTNWMLSADGGTTINYTFPSGSILPAGSSIIVFGGGSPADNFGGALLQTANNLGLTNSGGEITLLDGSGNVIQEITYGSEAGNGQSLTRDPEIDGAFVLHSNATNSAGALFSPGTHVDGSPFGADHAVAVRGGEGWRIMASPVQSATLNDFFGNFGMQGIAGTKNPSGTETIYTWTENGGGSVSGPPASMSDVMKPGQGYLVYFFDDDNSSEPGAQGGFPKIIRTNKKENTGSISISVSATDNNNNGTIDGEEGFNLLGNPFDTYISVSALKEALSAVSEQLSADIYIWDYDKGNGNGGYQILSDGDHIAPFQGFFVRYTEVGLSGTIELSKNALETSRGQQFYKNKLAGDLISFDLELHGNQYFDSYTVAFGDEAETEIDPSDAYKLTSLNTNAINLFSELNGNKLQKNALPRDLTAPIKIPLTFEGGDRKQLSFRWSDLEALPEQWKLTLIDRENNREVDLRRNSYYQFDISNSSQEAAGQEESQTKLLRKQGEANRSRFVLSIDPGKETPQISQSDNSVQLKPNYPNPFNPQTTIPYVLTEETEVKLTIWNMIGQKVATLVDGVVVAGEHKPTWNASNMPSGIYIARFEVNGEVFTRKMTLIK